MMPLRERFRRWMIGRYGADSLGRFLAALGLACMLLAMLFGRPALDWLGLGLLAVCYWRMFSRDIGRRAAENAAFWRWKERSLSGVRQKRTELAQRKNYLYCRCPGCRQKLRVPRGHGRIEITCPKCRTQFLKKS